jgi:phage terminase large subunit
MPTLQVNHKLKQFLTTHKPLKIAIGGRGSGKSIGFGDMLTFKMDTEGSDIYCLREYQDSLSDSVHRVFQGSITNRLGLKGWDIQKNTVIAPNGACTKYTGAARNPDSIQSAQDYKHSWFEEAHRASQESLDKLLPTILRTPGAECWFSANPQSSADPFSKRFIVPYLKQLQRDGYYEDDMHLIVVVNWRDNPWWNDAQEALRAWDYENLPRAKYDWIWEGAFNDSVEDSLIMAEWFDACVDAHKKLGFYPVGMRFSSHDPSDMGEDTKGFAFRHGSVILDVDEKESGDINEGCDWATSKAINHSSDAFTWDCDGMGVGLNRQVTKSFDGKPTRISMFRGSEGVDYPDNLYNPAESLQDQKTNKQSFKNKRAQYYFMLRDRVLRTYKAVNGDYHDPDTLISFDSSIPKLSALRSELCRMPIKPNGNGLFDLYTKQEMKSKFKFNSPNLADSVMMLMRQPHKAPAAVKLPKPIRPMGRR